jgi:hypothetical protein
MYFLLTPQQKKKCIFLFWSWVVGALRYELRTLHLLGRRFYCLNHSDSKRMFLLNMIDKVTFENQGELVIFGEVMARLPLSSATLKGSKPT